MNTKAFERKLDLCLKKLNKETDLDWVEIRDELGLDCSYDHLRKVSYGLKEYDEYIQEKGIESISDDMYVKLIEKELEIKKLMTRLSDMRTLVNKETREQARYEQLLEMLRDNIISFKSDIEVDVRYPEGNRKECIIALSDIHYGIDINNSWNKYNSNIAFKRMSKIISKANELGEMNECNVAHLFVGGDIVNGNIHLSSRLNNRETISQQVVGVSELLSQAILNLSKNFVTVCVHIVSGNHDRINPSKDKNDFEDNYVNVVKEFIKLKCKDLDNVLFNTNKHGSDIATFEVCNKRIVGVHGDKVPTRQAVQRYSTLFNKIDYVLSGHIHHDKIESFGNSKVITIPSFSGMDRYARELALLSNPSQKIIILENNSNDELIYTVDLSDVE